MSTLGDSKNESNCMWPFVTFLGEWKADDILLTKINELHIECSLRWTARVRKKHSCGSLIKYIGFQEYKNLKKKNLLNCFVSQFLAQILFFWPLTIHCWGIFQQRAQSRLQDDRTSGHERMFTVHFSDFSFSFPFSLSCYLFFHCRLQWNVHGMF